VAVRDFDRGLTRLQRNLNHEIPPEPGELGWRLVERAFRVKALVRYRWQFGIIRDTIYKNKAEALAEIQRLRLKKANVRARELIAIAQELGRKENGTRGKEPTYEMDGDGRPALTIPKHPGAMSPWTVVSVLDFLEQDVDFVFGESEDGGQ
jgi:hypothetical protein